MFCHLVPRTQRALRSLLPCLLAAFLPAQLCAQKAQRTVLSAEVYEYKRDKIYFDCVQTPFVHAEFHTNPGEEHHYVFETKNLNELLINNSTRLLLEAGDSLHVVVRYEGKQVGSVEFSGSERSVAASRLLWEQEQLRRRLRYKADLLACVALDIKPKDRIADSEKLLTENQRLLQTSPKASSAARNYVAADAEAAAYISMMEYPKMYAEVRKQALSEQGLSNYWTQMKGRKLRKDAATLRNAAYASMLMRYALYEKERTAVANGQPWVAPQRMEEMFALLADFYKGEQRDCVLFHLLNNFIRAGREVERADAFLQTYATKYNRHQERLDILRSLMQ